MTTYYTVEYRVHPDAAAQYDDERYWQHRKVQGFTSRANAEWALVELAKQAQFRGGGISSVAWDDDHLEDAA